MESNQDVFISHSSTDSKLAYAMCDYLEEKGIRCWIAPRDVQGGTEYAEAIIMGIRNCKIMVVLFNKNANDSIYVKNEVERAFNYKTILIPFKVDQTTPSATLELFLGSVHSLDATKGSPEDHFDLLYKNCERILGKKERVIEEKPILPVNTETKERVIEPFSSETNTNERLWSYWVFNLTTKTIKYGSINQSGAIVIQPMFDSAFDFIDGLAVVTVNGKWGYIDKKGNWVLQPTMPQIGLDPEVAAALDAVLGDLDPEDFNLEDYFGPLNPKVGIELQIDLKKAQNFLNNTWEGSSLVPEDCWVFYDKTFWRTGKEGFSMFSKNNILHLLICYEGYLGIYIFGIGGVVGADENLRQAMIDDFGKIITNMEIVDEQLVISILNEDDKHYWDFSSEINNALYEFFQEEIIPRMSSL